MGIPINIPGIGLVEFSTQEEVDNAQAIIDLLTLTGTTEHTNLDSQAQGSKLDPLNTEANPGDSTVSSLGFSGVKLKGYTQSEWESVFGTAKYNPATTAAKSFKDSTKSPVDRNKVQQAKIIANTPVYIVGAGGVVTTYNKREYDMTFPENTVISYQQSWGPGTGPGLNWSCDADVVDLTWKCVSCSQIDCDNCANGLPNFNTIPCPPLPSGSQYMNYGLQNLAYFADPVNGLTSVDCRLIRLRACLSTPGVATCVNDDGYSTCSTHYFGLANIPAAHYLFPLDGYVWVVWDDFMADIIAAGYTGNINDSFDELIVNFDNDPGLPGVSSWGSNGYFSIATFLCLGPCPDPIVPAPAWAGYSCNSQYCQYCENASANCGGNNSDGKIGWELLSTSNSGANPSFDWNVTDGSGTIVTQGILDGVAGTSTVSIGAANGPAVVASFTLMCWQTLGHPPGNYIMHVTNFTGGGNTYPDMNINGMVLGDTPLACPGDPICCAPSWNCSGDPTWICTDPGDGTGQYASLASCQANCASIPSPESDSPPDDECPCEGAQNCEECGDN